MVLQLAQHHTERQLYHQTCNPQQITQSERERLRRFPWWLCLASSLWVSSWQRATSCCCCWGSAQRFLRSTVIALQWLAPRSACLVARRALSARMCHASPSWILREKTSSFLPLSLSAWCQEFSHNVLSQAISPNWCKCQCWLSFTLLWPDTGWKRNELTHL